MSKTETIALAKDIIEKYKGMELEVPPTELLLARGILTIYGELMKQKYSYNAQSKYFPENDSLDWGEF